MSLMSLVQVADALHATLHGNDVEFSYVSTDTRTLQTGELFVALVGPNFDGHEFLAQAQAKGAVAAMVSRAPSSLDDVNLPLLHVEDTRIGLGQLAKLRRQQVQIPVVGVTGSCGKTTTKAMIAAILQQCGDTLATQGTLNNDFGVPLTLLRLDQTHEYAVIEMGANHFGEIGYVCDLAQPSITLITNAAAAHTEGFNDVAGVAKAKGEIISSLPVDGTAILNADDAQFAYWHALADRRRCITFGIQQAADITASDICLGEDSKACFTLHIGSESISVKLPVLGEHNIANALAAAAVAHALELPIAKIKLGLESMQPVAQRTIARPGCNGATVIDDSYNANPASVTAALKILANASKDKLFIFGEMLELGDETVAYHREVGRLARELGIKHLFAVGELAKSTVAEFGVGGEFFTDREKLVDTVIPLLNQDMVVLVKGSKANRMWEFVNAFAMQKE